jgi:hypothetical protein
MIINFIRIKIKNEPTKYKNPPKKLQKSPQKIQKWPHDFFPKKN